jgi:octaprenyl-diphosphate synthase
LPSISNIQSIIQHDLNEFEKNFQQSIKSKVSLLDLIMNYIVKRKGKQMRPMYIMLSAGMCGDINEKTYRGASLIELLHTATLVHDDVVDDAYKRRGFFSINALWKNKIAVLIGDYLLSRGLLLSVENEDFELLKIVSTAVKVMSEGELLQIEKARKLDITEEIYFQIITAKTASLIASACSVGAASVTSDKLIIEKMRLIGETAGIAFQIKDDLFDYNDADVGKPTHIDIKEKKMTLPLIYTLQQVDSSTKRKLINIVKNKNEDKKAVQELIEIVIKTGGIDYTKNKMNQYFSDAINLLKEMPESKYRKGLEDLIAYTIERDK